MPSSCAPAEIGTDLQDDRERSRQRSPALAALGSALWREGYGFPSPLPVTCWNRTLTDGLIRADQNLKFGTTRLTSCPGGKAAFVHRG